MGQAPPLKIITNDIKNEKNTYLLFFRSSSSMVWNFTLKVNKWEYYLLLIDGNTTNFRLNTDVNFPTKKFK
jgi:hypothetical protein